MAERQLLDQQSPVDTQMQSPSPGEDMLSCVMALEVALLPCLPARELQAIDRSPNPSHQSEDHLSLPFFCVCFVLGCFAGRRNLIS